MPRREVGTEELRVPRYTAGRVALGPTERLLERDVQGHEDEIGARPKMPRKGRPVARQVERTVCDDDGDAFFQEGIGDGRCFLARERPGEIVGR